MLSRKFLIVATLLGSMPLASAQPQAETTPSAPQPASSGEAMEAPQTGDHWTYEVRDEITGDLKSTVIQTITDVSASDISIRVSALNNPNTGFLTFDRSWNVKNNGTWRYAPSDGTGVSVPLAVGKSWPIKSNDTSISANANFRRTGTSKVTAKESLTTSAGTFDTYKIETSIQAINTKDPSRKIQVTQTTWYAPEIDHWVKRSSETRIDGQVRDKSAMELIEYGRR
ncbi:MULTISPECIES: hypothetical protein [unclassified Bradyrhizobium]|uniref:TapB family protein n=2 Tax=unclassified Bradyrhizobium TaxID=2631580 RepID=UPI0028EDDEBA|nr:MULTISPECIES: hypothetical protein [unclassified Bradyrhizobium]